MQLDHDNKKREKIVKLLTKYQGRNVNAGINEYSCNEESKKCVCTKRFLRDWENTTRLEYLTALASPKPIRLKPWPNPRLEATLPIPVPRGTIYGKIPERIMTLAIPKRQKITSVSDGSSISKTFSSDSINQIFKRSEESDVKILKLSQPKPVIRQVHGTCLKTEHQEIIYFKPKKSAMKSSEDWVRHKRWLQKNAGPKTKFRRPREVRKRSKLTNIQIQELLNRLAQVSEFKKHTIKSSFRKTEPRPPYSQITPMDLDWIKRLSLPRKLASETRLNLEYNPFEVKKSALKAKTTKRVEELSAPKSNFKNEKGTEDKENAFKVSESALKYKPTKRIKELAKPRVR